MRIAIEISNCSECPYFKTEFPNLVCSKMGDRVICEFYGSEIPPIPNWCPAALETILTDKEEEDFNATVHA